VRVEDSGGAVVVGHDGADRSFGCDVHDDRALMRVMRDAKIRTKTS
jgi:hypothetical protein